MVRRTTGVTPTANIGASEICSRWAAAAAGIKEVNYIPGVADQVAREWESWRALLGASNSRNIGRLKS
jgi:hypothetical protein